MLSLIIPVYRNESTIPDLLKALTELHQQLEGTIEVVLVVDGSPDRCYELLRGSLLDQPFSSKLALLSKNFGSFSAIRAGLEIGNGTHFAVMSADLQEPPELIVEMEKILRHEDVDVVVGTRDSRNDPILSRIPSQIFWWLYRTYVVSEVPPGGVDIFACNLAFRDTLLRLDERNSSLIAQIFWLGFRRKFISYVRLPRQHGKSAWTIRKKINYMTDSVFSFTDLPIRLLIRVGGGTAALVGIFGFVILLGKLMGHIPVRGYTVTILTIIFLGSVNLFGLGIVGSYAWRSYENTKSRPNSIIIAKHEFPDHEHKI